MDRLKQTGSGPAHDPGAIDVLNKGIALLDQPIAHDEIVRRGWNLLREDLTLPAAVLYEDALQHNLEWMRHFMDAYGVRLAPHGKTTMAPRLFAMQLAPGASRWPRPIKRRLPTRTACAAYSWPISSLVSRIWRLLPGCCAIPNLSFTA